MTYSKKKYLDHMVKTLDALHAPETAPFTFINNQGFGNIFDILKKEAYRKIYLERLEFHFGNEYAQTVLNSLKTSSLNSYFTPVPIIQSISSYLKRLENFEPKAILEPSAGNGLIIRELLKHYHDANYTAFEKEILTVRILEHNFRLRKNVKIFGLPFESLEQTNADKTYDLVVSNIPFGANKIFDTSLSGHPLQAQISKNIHSYFVYKSLASLKNAGVSVLVCTKNFMDKSQYAPIRKHLMESNNFIGGVRLPDSAFAQENTSVVTDIMVFQNNQGIAANAEQQEINTLFSETLEKGVGENSVQFSSYFSSYGQHVLGQLEKGGMYDQKDYTVKNEDNLDTLRLSISQTLAGFQISNKVWVEEKQAISDIASKPESPKQELSYSGNLKAGNLVIKQQKLFKILENEQLELINIKPREFDRLSKIIALRDTYLELLDTDRSSGQATLDILKYQYDLYDFQYGKLHDKANYAFVTLDIQGPMLLALEKPVNGIFVKADILENPWKKKVVEAPKKLSLEDAIYFSLNKYNGINEELLAETTGQSKDVIIKEALERQLLFLNPEGNHISLAPKFLFLSGTIYEKINFYRKNDFGPYQNYVDKNYLSQTIRELEKIKPPITPFEDLDIKLHEPWFPFEITQAFLYDTYKTVAHIAYNESTSKYMVKIESYEYQETRKFYVQSEHRSYYFRDILEGALNSTIPYITKGSKDNKRTDKAKMQEIRIKFELLYKDFNRYIIEKPELKKRLEYIFYKMYDAKVHPKYDGSYLKFEGLQQFAPYPSQKDTVAGIIINQGLLVNKEVGFGKTLDMALASQKLKELNLSKKTLIIGLRSTVIQLERELLNAFPTMNILVAHDKVVSGLANRNAFFAKIVSTDCDVVLMSHDTFKFIPQSQEIIHQIISEELANLERDLSVIYEDKYNISKRVLKGLETRRENLTATLKEVYFDIQTKQSEVINFDQMGFEHIMVDESHKFKNLMYTG
ncbi:Eco57I restriction-modification methylase domain-containing protein [Maribacter sp. 4G9]|uniref:Eco57I restriction-modification methylase domain-containing protein n=1 Tax=Maribacter sp. 4G9 TaxID=1889777 RepID=UPI000F514B68|nr:N-6 DNA methylase [Maribacter sp. 4G9]